MPQKTYEECVQLESEIEVLTNEIAALTDERDGINVTIALKENEKSSKEIEFDQGCNPFPPPPSPPPPPPPPP